MPCPYTKADLSAFIDGEMDDVTRQQIRNHLGECHRCHREVASLTTVAQMVRGLPRAEPRRAPAWDTDRLAERAPRPMRCTVVLPAASAYLDGELPADEAAAVVAHVATCDACHGVYKDLEGLTEVMGATERVAAPEGLQERILSAVEADNRAPAKVLRWVCVAGRCAAPGLHWTARLAAAAAFVLVLGYAVWHAVTPVGEAPPPRTISPVVATTEPVRPVEPVDGAAALAAVPDERTQPTPTDFTVRRDDVLSAVAAVTRRPGPEVREPAPELRPPSPVAPLPEGGGAPTIVAPPVPSVPVVRPLPPPHVSPSAPSVAALPHPVGRAGEPEEPKREPATSVPDVRLAEATPSRGGPETTPPGPEEPPRVAELPSHEAPAPAEVEVLAPRNTGWTPVYRPRAGMDREALDAAARRISATLEATKRSKPPSLTIHP